MYHEKYMIAFLQHCHFGQPEIFHERIGMEMNYYLIHVKFKHEISVKNIRNQYFSSNEVSPPFLKKEISIWTIYGCT